MSEITRSEFNRLESAINDINSKLDHICRDITEIETHGKRDAEDYDNLTKRVTKAEKDIKDLNDEHTYVKGQMKMLMIIGSVIVGLVIIAETAFWIASIGSG